ncbi:hypothetical protein SBA3_2910029 [Candidatus Sulfopaludibacter sp. SbA3]|nr:hypothetical protein SBA3_2910029 [Candidatus Sulfopaludibacter sp. SbA3]
MHNEDAMITELLAEGIRKLALTAAISTSTLCPWCPQTSNRGDLCPAVAENRRETMRVPLQDNTREVPAEMANQILYAPPVGSVECGRTLCHQAKRIYRWSAADASFWR